MEPPSRDCFKFAHALVEIVAERPDVLRDGVENRLDTSPAVQRFVHVLDLPFQRFELALIG